MADEYNYLKNFVLFSEMSPDHLQQIHEIVTEKHFTKNQTIFFEEETGDSVFFLEKGRVKVFKISASGSQQILDIFNPGEVFGEVVLFGINSYPATAVALEPVKVTVLNRDKFRDFFNQNPKIGWGMLKVMAAKLYNLQRRIKDLGLRDSRGRLAALLLEMSNNIGITGKNKEKEWFDLKINQQEMADIIGVSRETVSRTLGFFRDEGLIKLKDKQLLITDVEGLKDLL